MNTSQEEYSLILTFVVLQTVSCYLQKMSSSDLRDRMDGLQWEYPGTKAEAIMPGSSFLTYSRGDNVRIV